MTAPKAALATDEPEAPENSTLVSSDTTKPNARTGNTPRGYEWRGRLIPAGTGFAESKKGIAIGKIQAARRVRQAEALERMEEEAARPTGVAVDTTA